VGRTKKYEPLQITISSVEDIFTTHKCDIAKAILRAIKYGYPKKMKIIDFAELKFGPKGEMTVQLAIDRREFSELIDKNLQILEEFEEYEWCAEALKLKEKINKNKAKKELENQ
jgi:tRNA A37 threonylcarbamoyladenosine dehydratase